MVDHVSYSRSIRQRFRVLFSPTRLVLFVLSVIFLVVLLVVSMTNESAPEYLGVLAVIPPLAFAASLVTDHPERSAALCEQGQASPR